jgi:hypothetical protein
MKISTILFFLACLTMTGLHVRGQVAINSTEIAPDPSAMLDVSSTDQGVLIPRMTLVQRDAIASPVQGLLVFVSDDNRFYVHNGTGWEKVLAGVDGGWSVSGNNLCSVVSGSVGIGTDNPVSDLEVSDAGSNQFESAEIRVSLFSDGSSASPRYVFSRSHSPVLGDLSSASAVTQDGDILGRLSFSGIRVNGEGGSSSGAGWFEMVQKGSSTTSGVPGQFQVTTANSAGNRATRFVIDPDGKIGIGTINPTELLEVNGKIFLSGTEPMINFMNNTGTADRMIIRKNPASFGEINVLSNHELRFRTSDTDRIIIEGDGDIDMRGNQVKSLRIENRTSDPASPAVGQIWLRTDL